MSESRKRRTDFTVDGARERLHAWATEVRNASKKSARLQLANDIYAVLGAFNKSARVGWDAHIKYEAAQAAHFLAGFAAGPEPEKPDFARD